MTRSITDTNGAALSVLPLSVGQNTDSQVVVIEVPASTGMSLTAGSDPSASVLARRSGTSDPFVDLATAPISLTPYAGSTVAFDVKVHANAFAGLIKRVSIPVRVKFL